MSDHTEVTGEQTSLLTKAMIIKFYLPIGARTLDRWISCGRFPKADTAIGAKVRFWHRRTVNDWVAAQGNSPSDVMA